MYCVCACRENRRSGIPNWWCALPCFRLEQETNVIRRVYSETVTETEYSYDEEDEELLSDENEDFDDEKYEDSENFIHRNKVPLENREYI